MRPGLLSEFWCLMLLAGCASPITLRPDAEKVVVSDKPPTGTPKGLLLGVHGSGCGLFAKRGNREGALNNLRNKAVATGADHVVIKSELGPYSDGFCTHQAFIIEAQGYSTRPGATRTSGGAAVPATKTAPRAP